MTISPGFDFSAFQNQFGGDLVTPSDPDYEKAIARWAANAVRKCKVVAFVKDEADVGLAIKYAKANKLSIAIRGGGHSPAGASSSENGLVIDLSKYLNTVRVDAAEKLAYIGGGSIWEAVDKEAIQHGLATTAGTVNHTGVGGLALGGGYGWLTPRHGLVVDNIVQVTVVTADGSVLIANDTENQDLFYGIRGGGCNFGVVTQFVIKLHPQRRTVYCGQLIFLPSALERLATLLVEWYPKAGEDDGIAQIMAIGPDGNPALVVCPFYNGTEAEGREHYKPFFDLGPIVDMTKEIPYEELNAMQNQMLGHGKGRYFKGTSHKKMDTKVIAEAFEKMIEIFKNNPEIHPTIVFEYFSLRKTNSVPRGTTAFRRDPAPGIMVAMEWQSDTEDPTEHIRALTLEILSVIEGGQAQIASSQRLGYSNYDSDVGVPDKAKIMFDDYPRLQALKQRCDPDNIFNKWFAITPA